MLKWCKLSIVMIPFLMGAKCIDYDANYAELAGVNMSQVGEAGAAFDGSFVAADACPNANEAIIDVGDYYFAIVCGCLEGAWENTVFGGSRRCTVPTGTTVKWRFIGSEDHNVASGSSGFDSSADLIAGVYEWTFNTTGIYAYSCSLHSEMEDYTVEVREP